MTKCLSNTSHHPGNWDAKVSPSASSITVQLSQRCGVEVNLESSSRAPYDSPTPTPISTEFITGMRCWSWSNAGPGKTPLTSSSNGMYVASGISPDKAWKTLVGVASATSPTPERTHACAASDAAPT